MAINTEETGVSSEEINILTIFRKVLEMEKKKELTVTERVIREHDAEEFRELANTMNILFGTKDYLHANTPEYGKLLLTYTMLREAELSKHDIKLIVKLFIYKHYNHLGWMPADLLRFIRIARKSERDLAYLNNDREVEEAIEMSVMERICNQAKILAHSPDPTIDII